MNCNLVYHDCPAPLGLSDWTGAALGLLEVNAPRDTHVPAPPPSTVRGLPGNYL
jgi:hypothetical protein